MSVKYVDLDVEEKLEKGSPTLLHHLPRPWLEIKGYRGPHFRFHVKKWGATFDPSRPHPSLPIPPISSSLICNINTSATHARIRFWLIVNFQMAFKMDWMSTFRNVSVIYPCVRVIFHLPQNTFWDHSPLLEPELHSCGPECTGCTLLPTSSTPGQGGI